MKCYDIKKTDAESKIVLFVTVFCSGGGYRRNLWGNNNRLWKGIKFFFQKKKTCNTLFNYYMIALKVKNAITNYRVSSNVLNIITYIHWCNMENYFIMQSATWYAMTFQYSMEKKIISNYFVKTVSANR